MRLVFALALVTLFLSPGAIIAAEHAHENEEAPQSSALEGVTPAPNEAVIQVSGIVCSFCSQGLQRKLSKLPFVDRSKYKDGIHVSIEDQLVTIALKPNLAADIPLSYEKIRSGGYEPSKAWVADVDGNVAIYDASGTLCDTGC